MAIKATGKEVMVWFDGTDLLGPFEQPGHCPTCHFVQGDDSGSCIRLGAGSADTHGLVQQIHILQPEAFNLATASRGIGRKDSSVVGYRPSWFGRGNLEQLLFLLLCKRPA